MTRGALPPPSSHDHAIKPTGWTGTATWDPTNPSACKFDIPPPVTFRHPRRLRHGPHSVLLGQLRHQDKIDIVLQVTGTKR